MYVYAHICIYIYICRYVISTFFSMVAFDTCVLVGLENSHREALAPRCAQLLVPATWNRFRFPSKRFHGFAWFVVQVLGCTVWLGVVH